MKRALHRSLEFKHPERPGERRRDPHLLPNLTQAADRPGRHGLAQGIRGEGTARPEGLEGQLGNLLHLAGTDARLLLVTLGAGTGEQARDAQSQGHIPPGHQIHAAAHRGDDLRLVSLDDALQLDPFHPGHPSPHCEIDVRPAESADEPGLLQYLDHGASRLSGKSLGRDEDPAGLCEREAKHDRKGYHGVGSTRARGTPPAEPERNRMKTLKSYVERTLARGDLGLRDAGEPVDRGGDRPRLERRGSTSAAVLAYAREKGGPALRGMTFAQRAGLLKEMSQVAARPPRRAARPLRASNTGTTAPGRRRSTSTARPARCAFYAQLGRRLGDAHVPARRRGRPARADRRASGASTCWCPGRAWRCTSTPSTSRPGASPRRRPARCSPACR